LAYAAACVLTVIVVFSILKPGEKYIQGAVYIVGIPTLIISVFIFRRIFGARVGIWKYKCNNCGQELTILSNGKMAAFGTIKEEKKDKKIEDKAKIDEKAMDSLIENLKNRDSKVRKSAVIALADFEDSKRIEPLIEALKDEDERVRKEVANTLLKTGNRKAMESLVNQSLMDESSSVKTHIIVQISQNIKGIKAARNITKGMKSKDERIRDLAIDAYLKQGDQ